MQALSRTFQTAHQQAFADRPDRPKQPTRQSKGQAPSTYTRYHHRSANIHFGIDCDVSTEDISNTGSHCAAQAAPDNPATSFRNLQRNLRELGCPHLVRSTNQDRIFHWIQREIQTLEEQQKQARITTWRRRLKDSDHCVWKWLGRAKFTAPLTYIRGDNGTIHHGDDLIHNLHHFWQEVWPQPTEQERHPDQRHQAHSPALEWQSAGTGTRWMASS